MAEFETLPDILGPNLKLVFCGINPSLYAVARGHYFARKQNRFWPAFSRSTLSLPIRQGLGVAELLPEHDREFPRFGFGLTDVVKVPSASASSLRPSDLAEWAPRLHQKLVASAPRVICFQGMMSFRPFAQYALGVDPAKLELGLQPLRLGETRLFCTPNPSAANARYRPEDYVAWFDRLDLLLTELALAETLSRPGASRH